MIAFAYVIIRIVTEPEGIYKILKCLDKYVPETKPREHTFNILYILIRAPKSLLFML